MELSRHPLLLLPQLQILTDMMIKDTKKPCRSGFTLIEMLIVVAITAIILLFTYRIFFSQTKMVAQSIEFIQVNDSFRKIISIMGNDIKEATNILKPSPVMPNKVTDLITKPGVILHLQSSELDPRIPFDSPLGGQISLRHDITYELEKLPSPQESPRYKLIRTASIEESSGQKTSQRQTITDNIKDFIIYRTIKRPFKAANVLSKNDRIVIPIPLSLSGSGNNMVHLSMTLERDRKTSDPNNIYSLTMDTTFYKRGKEIFKHR